MSLKAPAEFPWPGIGFFSGTSTVLPLSTIWSIRARGYSGSSENRKAAMSIGCCIRMQPEEK
jgi:hypothetical protein